MLDLMSTAILDNSRLFAGYSARACGLMELGSFRFYLRFTAGHVDLPVWYSKPNNEEFILRTGDTFAHSIEESAHVYLRDLSPALRGSLLFNGVSRWIRKVAVSAHLDVGSEAFRQNLGSYLADPGIRVNYEGDFDVGVLSATVIARWIDFVRSETFVRIADDRHEWNRMWGERYYTSYPKREKVWLFAHYAFDRVEAESNPPVV